MTAYIVLHNRQSQRKLTAMHPEILHIGNQYLHGTFEHEDDEHIRKAYQAINEVNDKLFWQIPEDIIFTSKDPYDSAEEMRQRVAESGILYIYSGGDHGKYMTRIQNLISRAVHDRFAHIVCECDFTALGEFEAFLEQRKHYPEFTHGVLLAEIVGQACAYYANEESFAFTQRAIEAPSEWINKLQPLITK